MRVFTCLLKHAAWCIALLMIFTINSYSQKKGKGQIDSLIKVLDTMPDDTVKARLLAKVGDLYTIENITEARKYANQSLDLARKLKWSRGMAGAYNIIGISYAFQADYELAFKYWDKALQLFKSIGDKEGMLRIIGNKGNVYIYQGDYASAVENTLVALKYAEEVGDTASVALNNGNLGAAYEYMKDYPKALKYTFKALDYYKQVLDTQSMGIYLANISNLYKNQGNYREALQYQLTALDYSKRTNDIQGIIRGMVNTGSVYIALKEYDKAIPYLFEAIPIAKSIDLKMGESKACHYLGVTLLAIADSSAKGNGLRTVLAKHRLPLDKESQIAKAIKFFNKSIAMDKELEHLDQLKENYAALSIAQEKHGDYAGALASKKLFITINDSLFSMESKLKVTNLETKREIELKNKQLEINRLAVAKNRLEVEKNRLAVEKKRNIQGGLIAGIILLMAVGVFGYRNIKLAAAKELSENKLTAFQARMNPHFIFNSLNTIQSLILSNETMSSIKYLSEFSRLMRQILDNSARSKVLLKDEIQMLRSYISLEQLRYNNFTWEINIDEGVNEDTILVPGMIVQPFVENAIVHGFQPENKNGILAINLTKDDKHVVCTVDDNGIGRKKSAELNMERRKNHQSHGINIATSRLTLLNNKKKGLVNNVTYVDKEDNGIAKGTQVIIELPIL